jgi:hypothetical protein
MSSGDLTTSIIGYILFAISEILPFFPIHTNGVAQSLIMGFKHSFNQHDGEIELAQQLITKKPTVANLINIMSTNKVIHDCVEGILENQHIIPHIQMLCNNPELQLIFHSLNTNPMLLNSVKNLMLTTHQNNTQPTTQVQQLTTQQTQLQPITQLQYPPQQVQQQVQQQLQQQVQQQPITQVQFPQQQSSLQLTTPSLQTNINVDSDNNITR